MLQISKFLPLIVLTLTACGVKGPPSPPAKPAFIGNGEHPTKKNRKENASQSQEATDAGNSEALDAQ